jgi:hypothetical protein
MSKSATRQSPRKGKPVRGRPASIPEAGGASRCVWRDGLGPGFAVAASGRLVAYTASTAQGRYRCS